MLWDNVYEFFVKYIFGGAIREGTAIVKYGGLFQGLFYSVEDGEWTYFSLRMADLAVRSPFDFYDFNPDSSYNLFYIPLGNYLSLIATIISMVAILLFCVFIIKKIIAIMFRLFTGSGSF